MAINFGALISHGKCWREKFLRKTWLHRLTLKNDNTVFVSRANMQRSDIVCFALRLLLWLNKHGNVVYKGGFPLSPNFYLRTHVNFRA